MDILSFTFYGMMLFAVLLYYSTPIKYRWVILLGFSVYFVFHANGIKLALYMAFVIVCTYVISLLLDKYREKQRLCKAILVLGIVINGTSLILMKELNFFLNTTRIAASVFGKVLPLSPVSILAPVGISYYTLSLTGCLLDVYWGSAKVEKNVLKLALFAGYFPALVSAPILRKRESFEAIMEGHAFDYSNFCFGLQRIVWGMFKKLVISERLAVIVNTVYGDYYVYSGFYIWVAAVAFLLQLYTDFSGCIDICLGCSQLFGVMLPENFDLPFLSKSVSEFWRHWHITLGGWLRDYIYYPMLKSDFIQNIGEHSKKILGKKRGKKIPLYLVTMISWFLIGFWHGGEWNYIFGVGLFYGMVIVSGQILEPVFKKTITLFQIHTDCFSWQFFQVARTFFILAFANSFFRAVSLKSAFQMWRQAFCNWNPWIFFDESLYNLGLDRREWHILEFSLLALIVCGLIRHVTKKTVRQWLLAQNLLFRWTAFLLLVLSVFIYGYYGPGFDAQSFIYIQF